MNFSLLAVGLVGSTTFINLAPRFSPRALYLRATGWMLLVSVLSYPVLLRLGHDQALKPQSWILLLLFFNWSSLNRYMLLAFKKIELDNKLGIGFGLVQLVLLGLLIGLEVERDLMFFVYVFGMANALMFLLSGIGLYKYWPESKAKPKDGLWKAMLGQGFWAQLANISQFFSYRLSYYLIEDYLSAEALGIYGVAVSLAEALWIISRSVSLVQMSEIANTKELSMQRKLTADWSRLTAWFTFAVLLVLNLVPDWFYMRLFGEEFQGIAALIHYLSPGILMLAMSNIIVHFFAGKGKYGWNALISCFTLLLVLLVMPYAIMEFGLKGAAMAQSFAYFGGWLLAAVLFNGKAWSNYLTLFPSFTDLKHLRGVIKRLN
ncbi:MAG: lipopolysaccharide biosynthesis protein [Bacteroidia bacterium]